MRPPEVVVSMFSVMRTEARARVADPLHDVQHVLQRARQAIELPDDDRVALAQMVQQAMQFRPVPAPAGRGFLEQASATGGPECLRLQGVVLFVSLGDAGIAKQRAAAGRFWRLS